MDKAAIKLLFFFLLSILIVCSSVGFLFPFKNDEHKELGRAIKQTVSHSISRRELFKTIQHDFTTFPTTPVTINPATNPVTNPATNPVPNPATNPVTNPATNPVTNPATNPVTNPATNPVPNPATNPVTNPATNPVTTPTTGFPPPYTSIPANPVTVTPTPLVNPVNSPVPVFNPVTTPSTTTPQPVTTNPTPAGGTNPAVAPPVTSNAPAVPGQSWCVARSGAPESAIQSALDYACGIGGADCSAIQMGASCYNPNSLQNHASYAFNSYYQKNPVQTSCDFGGTAVITNVNPSSGSCIFTTSSSSSTSPTTMSPVTPTPNTASSSGATTPTYSGATTPTSSGAPSTIMNPSNPALGGGITGYGESPLPAGNSSSFSMSSNLQPFLGCIVVVTSIITRTIVFA
ncbi:hypothetical protein BUALT_Bualt19G0077000 [Buddleja alternifolia]|uniref:X8 domain-containing protein n=1 Tax=Buddleja alternifolia TaxID=168488 RepID=A0AAV6W2J6_9LAMI|nr:hypothetical protein BUALT_Bualt19G0077000 [Buddleja alternifolia]